MAPLDLFVANLNFTRPDILSAGFGQFAKDRSFLLTWIQQVMESWSWKDFSEKILQWLSRPGEQRRDMIGNSVTDS
ncbi:hypothetical protein N7478_011451 [Penicillium angulare]|uniref:uncharacterized protein n=1 Tax=Penicillium angulare TaxID=116970 RepID=UPI0025426675|nr:uncharacterized protein N7478_011451 [Penicillium angulare]KAJ5263846.1 hypothetical protein N7478_011451 [Penicillium angulare]